MIRSHPKTCFDDENGNLADDGSYLYYYDCENRLVDVNNQSDNPVAAYKYDHQGRRVVKTADGNTTKYAYDGQQVIAEYAGDNTPLRKFIYGPGIDEPICMIDVADSNKVYYYHFDGLGSVVALSDVNNMVVERYSYDVFGEPNVSSSIGNPYLFTGRRYDPEAGLYYYRARYYDYADGRFLGPDPIGYEGGINLYAYVGNNPVMYIDPLGLFRFGKRPLKGGKSKYFGTGPLSNLFNVEAAHEQGFFEDGTGDNIGFFDDNIVGSEDPTGRNYRYDDKHYDDDLMRQALGNVEKGEYSLLGVGELKKNNCQDWATRLRKEYRRLKKLDTSKCAK